MRKKPFALKAVEVIPLSALLRIGESKRKYQYAVLDVAVPPGWIGATEYDTRTGDHLFRAVLVDDGQGNFSVKVVMRKLLSPKEKS